MCRGGARTNRAFNTSPPPQYSTVRTPSRGGSEGARGRLVPALITVDLGRARLELAHQRGRLLGAHVRLGGDARKLGVHKGLTVRSEEAANEWRKTHQRQGSKACVKQARGGQRPVVQKKQSMN